MERKNKFYRRSKFSQKHFEKILGYFAADKTASQVQQLTKISVRSINPIYLKIRQRIADYSELTWQELVKDGPDEITITRTAVERPCPVNGRKILVLVLHRYRKHIYLKIAEDARKNSRSGYRSSEPGQILARSNSEEQVNEFWPFLTQRLTKFRGIPPRTFYLHVKETEFRFNYSDQVLAKLKEILVKNPL